MSKLIVITENVRRKGEAGVIPDLLASRTNENSYLTLLKSGMVAHQGVPAYIQLYCTYCIIMHTLGTIIK